MRRNLASDISASDHSVGDYIKLALIALKIVYLIYKMVKTMISNTKAKHKFMIIINVMAVLYIVELIWIFIFDLVQKFILLLFIFVIFSNYGQLMMFNMLMRTDHISNDETALKKLLPFNIVYTISFLVILVIMFIPKVGAYCTVIQVYPIHFLIIFALNLILSILILVHHVKKLFFHPNYYFVEGTNDIRKDVCFRKQTKCFTYFNFGTAIAQFIIGLVGVFRLEQSGGVIACDEGNNTWLQNNTGGNIFITLHIIVIIMQCSMFFLTFQKAPQQAGLFGGSVEQTEKRKLNEQSQKPHRHSLNIDQESESLMTVT